MNQLTEYDRVMTKITDWPNGQLLLDEFISIDTIKKLQDKNYMVFQFYIQETNRWCDDCYQTTTLKEQTLIRWTV